MPQLQPVSSRDSTSLPRSYGVHGGGGLRPVTGPRSYTKPDYEERCIAGSILVEEMGVPGPYVFYDPVEPAVVSVEAGADAVMLRNVLDGEVDRAIDRDSLMDAYAAKVVLGDKDVHPGNIAVLPGGTVYPFDFGLAGEPLDEVFDDVSRYAARALYRCGYGTEDRYADVREAVSEDLYERATTFAATIDQEKAWDAWYDRLVEQPEDMSRVDQMFENVDALASDNWFYTGKKNPIVAAAMAKARQLGEKLI